MPYYHIAWIIAAAAHHNVTCSQTCSVSLHSYIHGNILSDMVLSIACRASPLSYTISLPENSSSPSTGSNRQNSCMLLCLFDHMSRVFCLSACLPAHRTSVLNNSSEPHNPDTKPETYTDMAESHAGLLFDGYQRAKTLDNLERVFKPSGRIYRDNELLAFTAAYTGTIRDMCSCGVAALHTGLPLSQLVNKKHLVSREFNTGGFIERTPYLIKVCDNSYPAAKSSTSYCSQTACTIAYQTLALTAWHAQSKVLLLSMA